MPNPIPDPTRQELLDAIATSPYASEADDFDRERAIYWFATHNHGGQMSNLYGVLCSSEYRPGAMESQCDTEGDGMAGILYTDVLTPAFGGKGP